MTNEYEVALNKANEASAEFRKVEQAYRSRKIGDAEYLAARAAHKAAQDEFDVAFAKEAA